MKVAKDLMTKNPLKLGISEELGKAVKIFLESRVKSLPVINESGEVMGVLTEFAVVKAFLIHHMNPNSNDKIVDHVDLLERAHSVYEEDTISQVMKALSTSPAHRVMVNDSNNKIVGVISPRDLLLFLRGENQETKRMTELLEESNKKIKSLETQVKDLRNYVELYQRLFQSTPYMMHSVDKNRVIIMANDKIHEELGYKGKQLVGKTIYDIYPHSMHKEAEQGLNKIIETGVHATVNTAMVRKTGELIPVDVVSSSLKDDQGNFIGTISISRKLRGGKILKALMDDMKYGNIPEETF